MKRLLFAALLLTTTCWSFAQFPHVVSGSLVHYDSVSSRYISARPVDVWLPEGYSPANKYNVLYMHDGQMLFDSTTTWNRQSWNVDDVISRMLKEKKIKDLIVVGVWNGGNTRHADYFPQKAFELLSPSERDSIYAAGRNNGAPVFNQYPVQSDNYLRFLVKELKPFIDSAYSTYKDRKHTFIAGSSMGGLISLYAICEYPDVFGGAACLSTHWPAGDGIVIDYLETALPRPGRHKLYFDHGTETLDASYRPYQQRVDAIMGAARYEPGRNWLTRQFAGAEHSERAWRERIHIPLTFLLGPGASP